MGVYSSLSCIYITELRLDEWCEFEETTVVIPHPILWYFRVFFFNDIST